MSPSPEQQPNNAELGVETIESAGEQLEKLQNSMERSVESKLENAEKQAEQARVEALESAVSVEKGGAEKKRPQEPTAPQRTKISKREQTTEFNNRMQTAQQKMTPASKAFSQVIHNPAVEKTSEVVGATVARPNAILAGSISAFILTMAVYLVAKNIGYPLSGFETIGAFIVGWVAGMLIDYLRLMITGRTH